MKIFIIGLPNSGRTTFAKKIIESFPDKNLLLFSLNNWLKLTFRPQNVKESIEEYNREYNQYQVERLKLDNNLLSDNYYKTVKILGNENQIIDDVLSPTEFVKIFDYNKDIVVFLNRLDNDNSMYENDNIAINVIRDYCFWLASNGLLEKAKWVEYNFKIPGQDIDFIKTVGVRNTVHLMKSLNKVIEHFVKNLEELWK